MNFDAQFETREVHQKTPKIVWLCLASIFLICGILMAIFHPGAEFNLLFGEIKYFLGLFIIAALLFLTFFFLQGEHRDEKYYFTSDGKLDLSVPRYYTPLKRHKVIELITRKGSVEEFAYDGEENVYIKFRNGEELVAPLEDLTVSYTMDKEQFSGEFYISQMKVSTPEGNKYKVKPGTHLEDSEYDDIFMILSTAGNLKESKISKATKWVAKLKDAWDDFDFSNLVSSGIMVGTDIATSLTETRKTAENNVISFTKAKVFEDKKKKSWFKKAMEYFWVIVGIIYLILVLIVNIAALPEIFGGVNDEYNEYIEELKEENQLHREQTAPSQDFLEMARGEYYSCHFYGEDGTFYLALSPEVGEGVYQSPSGNIYYLTVEQENDYRTEFICSAANEEGWPTNIVFHIDFNDYPNVSGTMLGTDGETLMSFVGNLIENE